MTEQEQHHSHEHDQHSGTALEDDQLRAAAHVLDSFPVGSRLRRLVATGLDAGVIEIGDAMALEHDELQQLLEQAVTEGRLREPRPYGAPAPTHDEQGRPFVSLQEAGEAGLWGLPQNLLMPAAAALGQFVLDVETLRMLSRDELRELLRSAVAQGRLVNYLHQEEPNVFEAWSDL